MSGKRRWLLGAAGAGETAGAGVAQAGAGVGHRSRGGAQGKAALTAAKMLPAMRAVRMKMKMRMTTVTGTSMCGLHARGQLQQQQQ